MRSVASIFKHPEIGIRRFAINAATKLESPLNDTKTSKKLTSSVRSDIEKHFSRSFELRQIRNKIPDKYFVVDRKRVLQHLYLVNKTVAKNAVKLILPHIDDDESHLICEANPGLGLITNELLRQGIDLVRLYESCNEFQTTLEDLQIKYPSRLELITRNIFHLGTFSYLDKQDNGNRVNLMLKEVPIKRWEQDPVMSIIGPMPNRNFIRYLTRIIVLQREMATYGRPQIFAFIPAEEYIRLMATPEMKLRIYHTVSIMFQLLFDCELLNKYCKKSFLPWRKPKEKAMHWDQDLIYLVKITPKRILPVEIEYLPHLYYYVTEGFRRGRQKLIPTLENWLPGIGPNVIIPEEQFKKNNFTNINIYTEFGELTPQQILQSFLILLQQPEFVTSPFTAMMESHLLKDETVQSDLVDVTDDSLENIEETESNN